MASYGVYQSCWGGDASSVPCQLLASVQENTHNKLSPLYLRSIYRDLKYYHSVRSSAIPSPTFPLPTLLIVNTFHRQQYALF